ncbi:hypothetical protein DW086_06715 [Harryflintia acetispora]|nr:hypothetical protein DW086_06715 [Harryflintia acetispora]
MASMNKTELGFNQWTLTDKPTMDDFNADNLLTDQLLKEQYSVTMKAAGEDKVNVAWNGSTTRIGAEGLDVGSSFYVGKDYTVYKTDGGFFISLDGDIARAQRIGGFHYGTCRRVDEKLRPVNLAGEVRGEGWESNVYNGILPRSVWYKGHRPACDPKGMGYLGNGTWVDIYQSSDDGGGGLLSASNQLPLTGTEGLNWYGFVERALVVGKRLLTYQEFCQMAFGSPGGLDDSNENGWTAKTNSGRQKTGYVANAVSSIGCRDAVGNVWEWLSDCITRAEHTMYSGNGNFPSYDGGRGGKAYTNGNGHYSPSTDGVWNWDSVSPFGDGYGNIYDYNDYSLIATISGGQWNDGKNAGACTVRLRNSPWDTISFISARCACNSL